MCKRTSYQGLKTSYCVKVNFAHYKYDSLFTICEIYFACFAHKNLRKCIQFLQYLFRDVKTSSTFMVQQCIIKLNFYSRILFSPPVYSLLCCFFLLSRHIFSIFYTKSTIYSLLNISIAVDSIFIRRLSNRP